MSEEEPRIKNKDETRVVGFFIPVDVKFISDEIGHGVFAREHVSRGTPVWTPMLVTTLTCEELAMPLKEMTASKAHEFLRQGFVLETDDNHFCVNPNDEGRFMNHSSDPNVGYAKFDSDLNNTSRSGMSCALRDISAGEEMSCDYSGLGSPQWYKDLCSQYGVIPTDEVAKRYG